MKKLVFLFGILALGSLSFADISLTTFTLDSKRNVKNFEQRLFNDLLSLQHYVQTIKNIDTYEFKTNTYKSSLINPEHNDILNKLSEKYIVDAAKTSNLEVTIYLKPENKSLINKQNIALLSLAAITAYCFYKSFTNNTSISKK